MALIVNMSSKTMFEVFVVMSRDLVAVNTMRQKTSPSRLPAAKLGDREQILGVAEMPGCHFPSCHNRVVGVIVHVSGCTRQVLLVIAHSAYCRL